MKGMIFAAGLGTRLKPLTDTKPKALIEVKGRTLLEHAIVKLRDAGCCELIVNTHHFHEQIALFLGSHDFGLPIYISHEKEELLNTGGGLKKAADLFDNNDAFILYNADILSDIDLTTLIKKQKESNALAVLAIRQRKTARYLCFDASLQLCGWTNVETGELKGHRGALYAFSGIHVVSPRIFNLMPDTSVFGMIPLYLSLMDSQRILGMDHSDGSWADVGKIPVYERLK